MLILILELYDMAELAFWLIPFCFCYFPSKTHFYIDFRVQCNKKKLRTLKEDFNSVCKAANFLVASANFSITIYKVQPGEIHFA